MLTYAKCDITGSLGQPESNILRREDRHKSVFTAYPNNPSGGNPFYVADDQSRIHDTHWKQYSYGTAPDAKGVAYVKVDLKQRYYVRAFAVNSTPSGRNKPLRKWYLEGSNNGSVWRMVGIADASKWYTPGTFPFVKSQIVKCIYPRKYRYYRVIAVGWDNNWMSIFNWGLFS